MLRTELQIGVSLLDAGRLGPSINRLTITLEKLRTGDDFATLPTGLNYLAQTQLTIGMWDATRETLTEAIRLTDGTASAWHAYNMALLGKLHLEVGDIGSALSALANAWAETRETWLVNVATLVSNLYAEVLIATEQDAHLTLAREMLEWTVGHCREIGLARSELAALALLAALSLRRADPATALRASTAAVDVLEARGPQPALREEEVWHQHAEVLRAHNRDEEAEHYTDLARREVLRKAETLDAGHRQCFLTSIRLNALLVRT